MTHRASATVLGILAILALCATDLVRSMQRTTEGTTTYACNAAVAGVASLTFVKRRSAGKPNTWDVVQPHSKTTRALVFQVDTVGIGGAHGLRWRTADGGAATAILSFSDITSDYGPTEIVVELSLTDGQRDNPASQGFMLYNCRPDPSKSSLG